MTVPPGGRPALWAAPARFPGRLVTERLVLRSYEPSDARALFESVSRSRSSLLPWLFWAAEDHRSLEESQAAIDRFTTHHRNIGPGSDLVLAAFRRDDGTLVGGTGFHSIRSEVGQGEIGYWLDADHRRKGYCTESVRWLISWMLTPQAEILRGADGSDSPGWGFRRVTILCAAGNAPSAEVPTRLGLRLEVHRRLDLWIKGVGWDDTLAWGVVEDEWDRERHARRAEVETGACIDRRVEHPADGAE